MLEVCILHRALDDWEIKESNCCPTVGASYLQNYYLERQHEKYRCCLHWKTVFLAKITTGDGNSLQICFPLPLISAYTVNKKHDSRLMRATCYLLTRWHNLVWMLFKLEWKKKSKRKSKTFHEESDKTCQEKENHTLLPENSFLWKPAKRNDYQCCLSCRTLTKNN